jgi:hypothetical protein
MPAKTYSESNLTTAVILFPFWFIFLRFEYFERLLDNLLFESNLTTAVILFPFWFIFLRFEYFERLLDNLLFETPLS